MTITESRPAEYIRIQLEFVKPFEDTGTAEFHFKTENGQTVVTWSMSDEHNFISKAMCLIMSMDQMLGADFEKGLASLKSVVESKPRS